MSQAKTLTQAEIDQVLAYIATRRFALRNRVMLYTSFWSGMRVGEIASLKVGDVLNDDGTVKAEVRLTAEQTKGRQPRTVFLPQKLQTELQRYCDARRVTDLTQTLFLTAGAKAFSANVLAQHFFLVVSQSWDCWRKQSQWSPLVHHQLAAKGVGVRVLASLAGHRSIAVTQRYIDCNDTMTRNAVELL
jgi:integrase/recombinase XerD